MCKPKGKRTPLVQAVKGVEATYQPPDKAKPPKTPPKAKASKQ